MWKFCWRKQFSFRVSRCFLCLWVCFLYWHWYDCECTSSLSLTPKPVVRCVTFHCEKCCLVDFQKPKGYWSQISFPFSAAGALRAVSEAVFLLLFLKLLCFVIMAFGFYSCFFFFFQQKIENLKETTCVSMDLTHFPSCWVWKSVPCKWIVVSLFQNMVESIKHCIVLLQIAKVNIILLLVCTLQNHFIIIIVLVWAHGCTLCYLGSLG